MTKRDVLSIALRILGVIELFRLLISLPSTVMGLAFYEQFAEQGSIKLSPSIYYAISITYMLILLVFAFILISMADRIARVMIRDDREISSISLADSGRTILTIASQVFGIYLLATGLPRLVQVIIRSQESIRYGDTLVRFSYRSQNVDATATVVVGLLLLFLAKHIASLLYGRELVEQSAEESGA